MESHRQTDIGEYLHRRRRRGDDRGGSRTMEGQSVSRTDSRRRDVIEPWPYGGLCRCGDTVVTESVEARSGTRVRNYRYGSYRRVWISLVPGSGYDVPKLFDLSCLLGNHGACFRRLLQQKQDTADQAIERHDQEKQKTEGYALLTADTDDGKHKDITTFA